MDPNTINAFSQAVQALATKAGQAAAQYGPQALGIAEGYVHAMALLNLVGDLLFLAISTAAILIYRKVWKLAERIRSRDRYGEEDRSGVYVVRVVGGILTGGVVFGFGMAAITDFLTPATFFGLFEPQIAVLNYAISLTH